MKNEQNEVHHQRDGTDVHCAHDAMVDVTELVPNPRNPNKHGDKQIALLAKIIRHQGWRGAWLENSYFRRKATVWSSPAAIATTPFKPVGTVVWPCSLFQETGIPTVVASAAPTLATFGLSHRTSLHRRAGQAGGWFPISKALLSLITDETAPNHALQRTRR